MLKVRRDYGTDITIVEGEARGVDKFAARAAKAVGFAVDPYPANWKRYHGGAGHVRNVEMAETRPELAFGFGHGAGTNDMAALCAQYNIPLVRYHVTWPV